MLLENKRAVIYGAGAIGGAVAQVFAREGARVFLAGRSFSRVRAVAEAIGSEVGVAEVDALDPAAVDTHIDEVGAEVGGIDIVFNLISHGDVQGTPMVEMEPGDYLRPVETAVRTTFLTSRAAARWMRRQRSGVILIFGGAADPPRGAYLGGLQTAFHAMEAMRRQLSSELGEYGVRVVTLRTSGIPESLPGSLGDRADAIAASIAASTLLGHAATLEDVGNAAAFAASDLARTMTAASLNVSCGTFMD